ncbi:MAG: hypothetical protein VYE73_10250 [Acidobacteriota bacterium]|nr:hypothetical protein [Acidobacteriota bacterium]
MSLTARYLEENGIPTVILGSARDIVEQCGVPRFVFSDFPLGNSAGLPWQSEMQRRIVEIGLELLESARHSRTTVQTPFVWDGDPDWRASYCRVDDSNREQLARMGAERRAERARDRAQGRVRAE